MSVALQPAFMDGKDVELVYVMEQSMDPSFQAALDHQRFTETQYNLALVQEFGELAADRRAELAALAAAPRDERDAAAPGLVAELKHFDRPGTGFTSDGWLALVAR